MRLRRRWQRRMRRTLEKIYRLKMQSRRKLALLAVFGCLCVMIFWLAGQQMLTPTDGHGSHSHGDNRGCAPIDAVYTWVNGTDPDFIETIRRYDPSYDPSRFDDKNELKYSLRSLEQHANWIRHVYIVTNGQIPSWLDLNYDRVTVVPHEMLAPDPRQLPTFSSAAIETFVHRIPKLSKRFLYLNDDIFLGAPLYPEDLYTEAEGVRVYQAWMVPDCALDCPWTYIGDGACDRHCNIDACQFDGGDCNESGTGDLHGELHEAAATVAPPVAAPGHAGLHKFPNMGLQKLFKRSSSNFKELMRHKNVSTLLELRRIVERFNKDKLKSLSPEVDASNPVSSSSIVSTTSASNLLHKEDFKSSTDIYSHSLIATNMLLNRVYGFKARHVLAHVGFLIERDIVTAMQERFQQQVLETANQKFRAASDLQYAFAYYSFLMSETHVLGVDEIFDEFDTDGSGTWSDREVRTCLTRIYPPPLDWSAMRFFEEVVQNCSISLGLDVNANKIVHSTLVYERYEDSNLPTITRELVCRCPLLAEALSANFGVRPKYRYHVSPKRTSHSNFMMLTSNLTEVVEALDRMRRNPRKFNCINDNLDPKRGEDNELVRHLLEDFYLSFFPRRSKFELPPQYRNRYVSWSDYQRWRRRKRAVLVVGYGVSLLLVVFLVCLLCQHKAKIVRRCVQRL
ncbi:N-acetylglucosamine-1-phosphotransferase subunits alpha/beta [Drosophila sulfurigaster albostrigata]|uniref:N-acetylglucosamine-1-phosphotransferase subunits alpha/beta n=1 Tax=Drosophila sulfurigaster albostrigata TaxID=89887 RepID=UPI002D21B7E7|nr:N-acetylglucosamine-1-phosphotransferase subunits alpha/beta [Drosophila sulfurigaster albostrigata]